MAAFINPFLPVFFSQLGFTGAQIGVLSALRPWISAPCGARLGVPHRCNYFQLATAGASNRDGCAGERNCVR